MEGSAPEQLTQRQPFAVCPVDPPRRYADDFGQPRWSGGYHPHQGNDIFARSETPIRAPFDGRAETSWNWAGGVQIRVFGRLGWVFNGHASRAGKMGRVRAGQVIGWVGASGNASGGSAHDHFEWHPRGGPAVDPFPYLNQVCRGKRDRPRPDPKHLRAIL